MDRFRRIFPLFRNNIIGMIHVHALPGTPRASKSIQEIIDIACMEAETYVEGRVNSLLIENMHDIPYLRSSAIGPEIVASMTAISVEVRKIVPSSKPVGLQILAGANEAALAVAQGAQLQYIRAECFVFSHVADEGFMDASAGPLLRYRKKIGAEDVLVFSDIKKKHSAHSITNDVDIMDTAKAAQFFLTNGIILTGRATGSAADAAELKLIQEKVSDLPVIIGSGVTKENVHEYSSADALIIGSHFKGGGHWMSPLDLNRIKKFMGKIRGMSEKKRKKRYLFWCANEHLNFRIPEFEALGELFGITLNWIEKSVENPWVILDMESENEARALLSRSVSIRYGIELWGQGSSYEELHQNVKEFPKEIDETASFKICVEAFMNKLSLEECLKRIDSYEYLPLKGPVDLRNPDLVFLHFEFWGLDHNNLPDSPYKLFFGLCLSEGQRAFITKMSIKSRLFIGNTTMDPTLSLYMVNLAMVKDGDLVMDPFVGTGSLILAAAQFGGYVFGSDIDYLMMHARTRPSRVGQKKRKKGENMRGNFEQYGLEKNYCDILVADSATPPWRSKEWFNAIITDPPYGIREPTFKVGTNRENVDIEKKHLPQHFPSKVNYDLQDIISDLLDFAVEQLTTKGRLVLWIPVNREEYSIDKLPRHSGLQLLANCEQILSCHSSRRLLVYEKKITASGSEKENVVDSSTNKFRFQFFEASHIPRKEKKERVKQYGHLNLLNDKK